jgi:predicted nucleic acid-binding protein
MTEYNKVFLDTTPLIYFLDEDVNFGLKARKILEEILENEKQITSSAITYMEYMVFPYRTGNKEKIDAFNEFIEDAGIELIAIDKE